MSGLTESVSPLLLAVMASLFFVGVTLLVGAARRARARAETDARLRAGEERYRALVDAASQVVWHWNPTTRTGSLDASIQWWEEITGQTAAEQTRDGIGWLEVVHPDDRLRIHEAWAAMLQGTRYDVEYRVRARDGEYHYIWARVVPIYDSNGKVHEVVGMALDTTPRHRTEEALQASEEQLQAAQRLDVIGRLAGGMAHETNNQMSIILGATYFLLEEHDLSEAARKDVRQIQKAAEHTGNITRQLLAFSRQQVLQPEQLDLNYELENFAPIIRRTLGAQIELRLDLAPHLAPVRVDPGQLSQVVLNLVLNARDAMPQHGTLTIATANITLDAGDASALGEPIPDGPYVVLSISDTGDGIDQELLDHVFEPFFTTKPVGTGTGLGLSTVHGIVRQSNGYIAVTSTPEVGTTFRVFLPHAAAESTPIASSIFTSSFAHPATLLIVDDQPEVRSTLARALRNKHYTVLEASSAADALDAAAHAGPYLDLLITDLVMPQMSGNELAQRLRTLYPDLPVLFTSGYADEEIRERGLLDAEQSFLQKPYTPDLLIEHVQQMLEHHRSEEGHLHDAQDR